MRYGRLNLTQQVITLGDEFRLGSKILRAMQTTPKGMKFMNIETNRYLGKLYNDADTRNKERPKNKKTFKITISRSFWAILRKIEK